MNDINDLVLYTGCMEELKKRQSVIAKFLNKKRTTGHPIADAEFTFSNSLYQSNVPNDKCLMLLNKL